MAQSVTRCSIALYYTPHNLAGKTPILKPAGTFMLHIEGDTFVEGNSETVS